MANSTPPLLRPLPQRAFGLEPAPSVSSHEPSPTDSPAPPAAHDPSSAQAPPRTRSVLNLTASTLFGIYAPSAQPDADASSRDEASPTTTTSPGTPALSPKRPASAVEDRRPPPTGPYAPSPLPRPGPEAERHGERSAVVRARDVLVRTVVLYLLGVLYGGLVVRLHDRPAVAPVRVAGIDHRGGAYVLFWGAAGVGLGHLLPWLDRQSAVKVGTLPGEKANGGTRHTREKSDASAKGEADTAAGAGIESRVGGDWITSVRSVGVFIGIAFAIRRLPWQSTLQASLTLALANPMLWYLLDRTRTGFALAAATGIAGTSILLAFVRDIVPLPVDGSEFASKGSAGRRPDEFVLGLFSHESIGLWTWIASVLFCSCLCFGNVGRWLTRVLEGGRKRLGHTEA